MDTIVDATLEALNRLEPFKKDIIAIDYLGSSLPEIHVHHDAFFKHFDNYKATYRICDVYPIELFYYFMGVKFYAIYKVEDFHAIK